MKESLDAKYTEEVLIQDDNLVLRGFYGSARGKLVGYAVEAKNRNQKPKFETYETALFISYSQPKALNRKMKVIYKDDHLRLLSFGDKPQSKDYLLALKLSRSYHNDKYEHLGEFFK